LKEGKSGEGRKIRILHRLGKRGGRGRESLKKKKRKILVLKKRKEKEGGNASPSGRGGGEAKIDGRRGKEGVPPSEI